MIIRHFQNTDFEPVSTLLNRTYRDSARMAGLTPERLEQELTLKGGDPKRDYLVVESQQGQVVGFCGYSSPGPGAEARMDGPVISYPERGQGLGERLWHELADLMRSRRIQTVSVMLESENRIAERFLKRLGFEKGSTQLIVTSDRPYEGTAPPPPELTLRRLRAGDSFDRSSYLQLFEKLFQPRRESFLELLLGLPDYHIFLAERGGQAVGLLELELVEDVAIIESFGVHPDFRRAGYGSALLRAALEFAWRHKGIKLVRQIWKTDQPEFLKVYTQLGFKQKAALHRMSKKIG